MKLRTTEYFVREVCISIKRNNWMSFASISTVAVSLFVLGMFLIIVLNMNRMASMLESQVQINVYLDDKLKGAEIDNLEDDLKKMQGIESVQYVSREDAIVRLRERLGDQKYLLDALGDKNPLPNAFEVTVKQPTMVETAAKAIEKFGGVESVKYGQDVVEHLFDMTRLVRIFGFTLMLLLAGATLFIISNTIRLTVFARRKEIAIMKYVGATDWFIRWPFLLEGVVLGFFGGILASIALRSIYGLITAKVYSTLAFLPLIPQYPFVNFISLVMVLSGMGIGALGSTISLKRFLKV
ncbi:permease-like cell division protein FtsX [Selenomonas sputigena]|uniref:permease-like cell division protein FtsX n=1 Tax=Selenomonas sputigena TaxID=69823 RepID=UPI00222F585C|nr:permease-like cell division protein FtsX [Selenomonas sputigena]UZD44047.1 permease-like cell division protein FtsX [Selenomonas sputigena]